MKKEYDNLKPGKGKPGKGKPSDEKIDEVLNNLNDETHQEKPTKLQKQKQIQFNVKLPENLYNVLDEQSKRTGLSKKAILVSALWDKLG